jgi:hypothetical protein
LAPSIIALLLGGIAIATAPATPYAIVHELRAKGSFTSSLLGSGVFEWKNLIELSEQLACSSVFNV